ncbi:MAG: hypothetical protein ACI4QD_08690, partial [Kiritimatiellia bacterium]
KCTAILWTSSLLFTAASPPKNCGLEFWQPLLRADRRESPPNQSEPVPETCPPRPSALAYDRPAVTPTPSRHSNISPRHLPTKA